MIIEYHRPSQIDEAIRLLERKTPPTIPLGGGNVVSKYHKEDIAVVDLQELGMSFIDESTDEIKIGCTTTLQNLFEKFSDHLAFKQAIKIDATRNRRQTSTIGGFLKCSDGRSAFLTLLLSMDPKIKWLPKGNIVSLGNWLPQREQWKDGVLISEVSWQKDLQVVFESVGRTPLDKPIVCCAIAKWPSGRIRVAVGGLGKIPLIALDGDTEDDIQLAIKNILHNATDQWATAEYRIEVGSKLGERLFEQIKK